MHHSIWNENDQSSCRRDNTKSFVNLDHSALHSTNQERNLHGLYRHAMLLKDPDKKQCLLCTSTSLQNLSKNHPCTEHVTSVVLTFSLNFQVESVPGEF